MAMKSQIIYRRSSSGVEEVIIGSPATPSTNGTSENGEACSRPSLHIQEDEHRTLEHAGQISCCGDDTCNGETAGMQARIKLSDIMGKAKVEECRYPSFMRGIKDLFSSVKPVTEFSFWFGIIEDKNINNLIFESDESSASSLQDGIDGSEPSLPSMFDEQDSSVSMCRHVAVQTDPAVLLSCITQENVREGYSYWKVVTLMLPTLLGSLFYTLDVVTDIKLAVVYFRGGNVWWGSICSFFILMPSLFINTWLYQRLVSQGDKRKLLLFIAFLQLTPLYVNLRKLMNCWRAWHGPENLELTVKGWKEVEGDLLPMEAAGLESTYESKFQLHLQMYVLLVTMSSEEEWIGLLSVLLSLCSMSLGKAGVARNIKGKIVLMLTWIFILGSHVVVKSAVATEHWGLWFASYGLSICLGYATQLLENKHCVKMFISRLFKKELGILWTSVALNNEVDLNRQIGPSFIYLMFAIWFISQDKDDGFRLGVLLTSILGPLIGFMFARLYNKFAKQYMRQIKELESPSLLLYS